MFAVDTAPATLVRDNFKDYCAEVRNGGKELVITRHDKPEIVMLSIDDYNALMNREYLSKLDESLAQIARGDCITLNRKQMLALGNGRSD